MRTSDLIDQYEHGGLKLKQSIAGLLPEDLDAYPVDNAWSIRQIVAHVLDSELVYADRMKRVIAEDKPVLLAYDENKWVKALHYDLQSTDLATELVELNRKQLAAILRLLDPAAFARTGNHTERGVLTLAELLDGAVKHLDHHLKFVYAKREMLGKLMW